MINSEKEWDDCQDVFILLQDQLHEVVENNSHHAYYRFLLLLAECLRKKIDAIEEDNAIGQHPFLQARRCWNLNREKDLAEDLLLFRVTRRILPGERRICWQGRVDGDRCDFSLRLQQNNSSVLHVYRQIHPNPWREIIGPISAWMVMDGAHNLPEPALFWQKWLTDTVKSVSASVIETAIQTSICPKDGMQVLADSLIDAGCDLDILLQGLRDPCEHPLGYWPMDLFVEDCGHVPPKGESS